MMNYVLKTRAVGAGRTRFDGCPRPIGVVLAKLVFYFLPLMKCQIVLYIIVFTESATGALPHSLGSSLSLQISTAMVFA
jgi:hypothetical protein